MSNISNKDVKKLVGLYEVVKEFALEQDDPFAHFYEGGTEKFFSDFEDVLAKAGVTFVKECFALVEYEDKYAHGGTWGIAYDDPEKIAAGNPEWCLTGLSSLDQVLKIPRDKSIFKDYAPRVYPLSERQARRNRA